MLNEEQTKLAIEGALRSPPDARGKSGETEFDELIRSIRFGEIDPEVVSVVLPQLVPDLDGPSEWHLLQILVSRTNLRNPAFGEQIEDLVSSRSVATDARLWAASAAASLGAAITSQSWTSLSEAKHHNLSLWFSLVRANCQPKVVDDCLVEAISQPGLGPEVISDLVRAYYRWTTEFNRPWTVTIGAAFEALSNDLLQTLEPELAPLIGPTFFPGAQVPQHVTLTDAVEAPDDIVSMDELFRVIDRVSIFTDNSKQLAEAA